MRTMSISNCLLVVTLLSGCAAMPRAEPPVGDFWLCPAGESLAATEVRLVANGWSIDRVAPTYLQTRWRIQTRIDDQVNELQERRGGYHRIAIRVSAFEGPARVWFRVDSRMLLRSNKLPAVTGERHYSEADPNALQRVRDDVCGT